MAAVYRMTGQLRHYAWGGQGFITDLFGMPEQDQPVAEYWLGAHSAAPSALELAAQQSQTMDRWLAQQHSSLPYLLKVLDVARPLSIQVHPDRQQAERGFELENQLGIPLDSPRRNYRDRNPKPELALALGDFYLLYGFLPDPQMDQALSRFDSLKALHSSYRSGGLRTLFPRLIHSSREARQLWLEPIYRDLEQTENRDHVDYWLDHWQRLAESDDQRYDTGVLCMLIMNLVHLQDGQAIFQDSNVPHAYLHGRCVEAMANSDNVVRCGLTPKHVDVAAMVDLVSLEQAAPSLIRSSPDAQHTRYAVPVADFRLERWRLKPGSIIGQPIRNQSIALVLEGSGVLRGKVGEQALEQGTAFYLHQSQAVSLETDTDAGLDVLLVSPGEAKA